MAKSKKKPIRIDPYRETGELVCEKPNMNYFKVPELDTFGYLYVDIPGFDGRYILSEKGMVYERTYNKSGKLVYIMLTSNSDNFFESKDNNERGEKNKYPTLKLIKPNGKKKTVHTDDLVNKCFNEKPVYIMEKASLHNHLFDCRINIDEGDLRTARKDAKEYCLSAEDVRWASAFDIQKDSCNSGRNPLAFLDGSKSVAVSSYETGELLYIFESENAAGRCSTAPNGNGGNVSKCVTR